MPYIIVTFFCSCKKSAKGLTPDGLNTSNLAKFESISSLKADLGDTLIIRGKRLLNDIYSIKFDTYYANIFFFSDSLLKIQIPETLPRVNPCIIAVFVNSSRRDTIANSFSLNTPKIISFPATARYNDTITITGEHFNNFGGGYQNAVIFYPVNTTELTPQGAGQVLEYSHTKLKVIVPDRLSSALSVTASISITAQVQTVKSSKTINLTVF
ncbi:MAG: hypothetical protein ACXVAY_17170 [Mucilaginibacter sp.]